MITPSTHIALTILKDIALLEISPKYLRTALSPDTQLTVLSQLEAYGLILLSAHQSRETLCSYTLARPLNSITLLDVLNAIGEHLDCSREADEQFYGSLGLAARKLGVINTVTRQWLSEIKLTDLV